MNFSKPVAVAAAVGKAIWFCVLVLIGKVKPEDIT